MKQPETKDWAKLLQPLFKQYSGRKHPLENKNHYQLLVMVILSPRTSDKNVNACAPPLFKKYPTMKSLATAKTEDLHPLIKGITNFANKANWLMSLANKIGDDKNIPKTLDGLTELSGIGRKSANVILSETGGTMEGVIVDLHVLRVAPRIGIAQGTNPEKIEQQLMEAVPQKYWRELGMSLTHLGREICRPTDPNCGECVMNKVCEYYQNL